jgi:Protein of unknown function (DUF1552)
MNNTSHGPQLDRWTPVGLGADFKLNAIMKSLEPYKKYVTSFGNIKNDAVIGTQHVLNPATWLSGMKPEMPGPKMSVTLDQIIAGRIAEDTPFRSLEVSSLEPSFPTSAGNALYASTLSFRDAISPLRMEYNPHDLFVRLFHDEKGGIDEAKEEASLLDLINEGTHDLQRELNPSDRAILDSHLTAVREVEQSVQKRLKLSQTVIPADIKLPPVPKGVLDALDEQVRLMFDLIAIAYQADLTRVVSFMMVSERTNQTYGHIGVPDSFHPVSHHANDLERINKLVKIQTWHMDCFAEFLATLASVHEGEGTLLDNSIFLYGSNMSNSDTHSSQPLPTVLVGGGAGKIRGGRHIDLANPTPIANLHLTLMDKVGIERKTFGDSTGTIEF